MTSRPSVCPSRATGTTVMVRAVDDQPVLFIAIAAGRVVVEVVDEDPDKRASIGVPRCRVFAHDERLFRQLRVSYDHGQQTTLGSLWARAVVPDLRRLPPRERATKARTHPS